LLSESVCDFAYGDNYNSYYIDFSSLNIYQKKRCLTLVSFKQTQGCLKKFWALAKLLFGASKLFQPSTFCSQT